MTKDQLKKLEADLWRAADALRANSDLKASEYSTPVLGLIFLKFADNKYKQYEPAIHDEYQRLKGGRREKTLSEFAMSEGQGGGEFFTPRSVVRLMVEIIEPHGGRVFDPACGSGGMFVQSAQFVEQHRNDASAGGDIYVCGQEKTLETVKLAKMNLAVNGLRGEIRQANTYSEDPFGSIGEFDYVLANPPFNVDEVPLATVEKDPRFNAYGIPRNKTKKAKKDEGKETVPNGNYLWINLFATSLKDTGRAALVMANSASDARHSEADIRQALIEHNLIYGMLTLPSNMFYTVTLPATLWFFDKAKADERILFIDARNVFTQIDRAHREFSEEQIQNIAIISRLHKGKRGEFVALVERYLKEGVAKLSDNHGHIAPLSQQLLVVLEHIDAEERAAVTGFVKQWDGLAGLKTQYARYLQATAAEADVDKQNAAQHRLRAAFDPFFKALHDDLKALDRIVRRHEKQQIEAAKAAGKRGGADRETKALKSALEALHAEVRSAESWFKHIHWLQERFPEARYEDVIGLCKLASPEEVKEQDWSLNPGRYVGVVIEEDGKTEEEFLAELAEMRDELEVLNAEAQRVASVIAGNLGQIVER
jgi:type I restriction enzyme M protein